MPRTVQRFRKVNVRRGRIREMGVSLIPPETVRKLQETVQAKAKRSPGYRFYAGYDRVYRFDVLLHTQACCQANGGAAGVEGQTFDAMAAFRPWLGRKCKVQGTTRVRSSDPYLRRLELIRLEGRPPPFS